MTVEHIDNSVDIYCSNEYGKLERVIVCPPEHMEIKKIINNTQRVYASTNIDRLLARKQHNQFISVLKENGTEVIETPVYPVLNEQVFTRDVGFAIGGTFYLSHMANPVRKDEPPVLEKTLQNHGFPYKKPFRHPIEGGDVIVDEDIVWIGISERTTMVAAENLAKLLPFHRIEQLKIDKEILHLDCAFNVIGEDWALIYREAFTDEGVEKLKKRYNLIEVSEEEQFTMGTNTLSIGNSQIISLPENTEVNKRMAEYGFEIIEVDFSEIIKSGGSFRCCSLPLVRR